jgi:hypothetical protein
MDPDPKFYVDEDPDPELHPEVDSERFSDDENYTLGSCSGF